MRLPFRDLAHQLCQTAVDFLQELLGVHLLLVFQTGQQVQISCHDAVFNGLDGCLLKIIRLANQFRNAVQLTTLAERTAP